MLDRGTRLTHTVTLTPPTKKERAGGKKGYQESFHGSLRALSVLPQAKVGWPALAPSRRMTGEATYPSLPIDR